MYSPCDLEMHYMLFFLGLFLPLNNEGLNQCDGLSAVSSGAQDSAEEAKEPWVEVGRV